VNFPQSALPKYPLGTLAYYGPDDQLATKLVAAVHRKPRDPDPILRRWISTSGDIRHAELISEEVKAFFAEHRVKEANALPRIFGCPHEEGMDYPDGEDCPQCPFWARIDRFTGKPKAPSGPLSADDVITILSNDLEKPPVAALAAADMHREAMTPALLKALEAGIANPVDASDEASQLFAFAVYLLAKWRETRAYPLYIQWLSLPGEGPFEIGGDIPLEDGGRMLASVCGGDLGPIKGLIENREANEYCRGIGFKALGALVAWGKLTREELVPYYLQLAEEKLERVPNETEYSVWNDLAESVLDLEMWAAEPHMRRGFAEGLIDPSVVSPECFDTAKELPPGSEFQRFCDGRQPITDVAEIISWWSQFHEPHANEVPSAFGADVTLPLHDPPPLPGTYSYEPPKPYIAPPKVGRNDPCPCGSGKKYKKCCGG
jgi:hypothetical protein